IAQPDAGLITVVQPAHLHGLGTLDGVAAAKGELFRGLKPGATAVVNADDPKVVALAEGTGVKSLSFGRAETAIVRLVRAEARGKDGIDLAIVHAEKEHAFRLALVGEHNAL